MKADILPVISGRIVLRRLQVSDLAAFQAYRRDPEVARYQGWGAMTDAEARSFLADVAAGDLLESGQWCQVGIALVRSGRLIGDIGIHVSSDEDEAEIGISLCRETQGRGLASEAAGAAVALVFAHTGVGRLLGITDVRNLRSVRLLERIGMRKIGEQDSVVKGESCRELVFAVARGDVAAANAGRGGRR